MKKFVIYSLLSLMALSGFGQTETADKVMPQFPGGDDAFYAYLDKKVVVPSGFDKEKFLQENKNQYVPILVGFSVDVDGSITNVKVIDGATEALDNKAKEIIEQMPKWEPGKIDGNPIQVQYAIPIRFNLML